MRGEEEPAAGDDEQHEHRSWAMHDGNGNGNGNSNQRFCYVKLPIGFFLPSEGTVLSRMAPSLLMD
jgi:hypothetical protein